MEDDNRPLEGESHQVECNRCPKTINPGETYVGVYFCIETKTEDGLIHVLQSHALTELCFGCASVMLVEAAVSKKMLTPTSMAEDLKEVKKRFK